MRRYPSCAATSRTHYKNDDRPLMSDQTAKYYWAIEGELKWAIQVSNQGHPACKAGALPLS